MEAALASGLEPLAELAREIETEPTRTASSSALQARATTRRRFAEGVEGKQLDLSRLSEMISDMSSHLRRSRGEGLSSGNGLCKLLSALPGTAESLHS